MGETKLSDIDEWSGERCIGWLYGLKQVALIDVKKRGETCFEPVTVVLRDSTRINVGKHGADATDDDLRRACREVHHTIWPEPERKKIEEMDALECYNAAAEIDGWIAVSSCGTTDQFFACWRLDGYAPDILGTVHETSIDALRKALRCLAVQCSRYDRDTNTIIPNDGDA